MERGPLGPGTRGRPSRRRPVLPPVEPARDQPPEVYAGRRGRHVGRPYLLATIHQDTGEMRELAATLGLRLVLEVYQSRNRPHPGTFLGRGKLEALRRQLDEWRAGILPHDWQRREAHWVPMAEAAGGTAAPAMPLPGGEEEERRGGDAHGDDDPRGTAGDAAGVEEAAQESGVPTAWGGEGWRRKERGGDPELPKPGAGELLLILDEDVRPGVLFNLEERLGVEVWDRTRLILEIFSEQAHLKEAALQVELAKLHYEVPLIQEAIHRKMGRERPGFMGGGEYAVADYRDFIKRRMRTIRDELEQVRHDRSVRRKVRRDRFYQVALAGYTNAGKSSLLAALTGADTLREGALFTTLSTMTRRLDVPAGAPGPPAQVPGEDAGEAQPGPIVTKPNTFGGDPLTSYARPILLTDTVGFIRALPSWLLDAFHATLEEIALSDVVLLVADASDPEEVLIEKVRVCQEELAHLDVTCPVIIALNKMDRLTPQEAEMRVAALVAGTLFRRVDMVLVSAHSQAGLARLVAKVQGELPPMVRYRLVAPGDDAGRRLVGRLYGWGGVEQVDYGERVVAVGTCDPLHWKALQRDARAAGAQLGRRTGGTSRVGGKE